MLNIAEILRAGGACRAVVEAPGETVFACPSLTSLNGETLVLAVEDEHTPAGRTLVGALWFGRPLTLWLSTPEGTYRAGLRAYRCHIVGPVFSVMLARRREEDPEGDLASAWELTAEDWTETEELPPEPEPQSSPFGPELHLDNSKFRVK